MALGKLGSISKEWNWIPLLYHSQKLNGNGLKTNIKPETIRIPEENIGEKLFDIVLGNDLCFFGYDTKSTVNRAKNK